MAIALVAKKTVVFAGGVSAPSQIPLTSGWNTTYGSATYAPVQNDVVIVSYATGSAADRSIGVTTAGYTEEAELYSNDTEDTNLSVSWKRMSASPDTALDLTATGNGQDAGAVIIEVWSGVDTTTAMDVTPTTATGIDTGRPNPPAIAPVTGGAVIVVIGAGAAAAGAVYTQPGTQLANFLSATSPDTHDAMIASGDCFWVPGSLDPVAWTGGTTGTGDSWCAVTLALRPAAPRPVLKAKQAYMFTGSAGQETIDLTTGWNTTFGSATYTPVENDIVIVTYAVAATADEAIGVTTSGYTEEAELFSDDTYDTNLSVSWKRMGASPDIEVQVSGSGGAPNAKAVIVEVWGYVNISTAIDVTTTTATGINTGRPDPPSITPSTAESVIVVCGASATTTSSAAFTQTGTDLVGFLSDTSPDTFAATVGTGYKHWVSGAFNPVAWLGGSTAATDSWAAVSLVLRPFVPTTVLVVANATSASLADNVVLSPKTALAVADATSASLADNVVLASQTALVVADATSASLADNIVLAPQTALIVADAVSAGLADNITLSPQTALVVANAVSAGLADNITITFLGGGLVVQSADSASLADNVIISPQTALVVADAVSASLADNVVLTPRWLLATADAVSASQADSIIITGVGLAVQSATSLSIADSPTLLSQVVLVVQDAVSASTATSPTLGFYWTLLVGDAVSGSVATSPTLLPQTLLVIDGAVSASQADNVVMTYFAVLAMQSAVSLSTSTNVALGYTVVIYIPPRRQRVIFRYNDPESINIPKLNYLALSVFTGQKDVLTLFELSQIAPVKGLEAHCWDATGGYAPVYADGTNWRRTADNTIVS